MAIEIKTDAHSTEVPEQMEESMDPPSFIKTQSKRILEIEDGLDDIHKMIEEKASRIEEKLGKFDSGNGEEEKELLNSQENQLVPYYNPSNSGVLIQSTLMKRESSTIEEYSRLKMDSEGIISLSDVDDEEIEKMILTEEESRLKKIIWDNLNKDWIKDQKRKKRERKEKRKMESLTKKKTTRVKSKAFHYIEIVFLESDVKFLAKTPMEAIKNSAKFANINPLGKIDTLT